MAESFVEQTRRRYPWTSGIFAQVVPPPAPAPDEVAELRRTVALLELRGDFPLADQSILRLVQGTPEQLRETAKLLHEQAAAAAAVAQPPPTSTTPPAPAPAPAPSHPTPQPAPGPAPVPGPGQVLPPTAAEDARYNELKYKVEVGTAEPHERKEFFEAALRNSWNAQVEQMNARHGR